MKSQIFKIIPPKNIIYKFLEKNANLDNEYYIFSKANFKSAIIKNEIGPLLTTLRPYYYISKLNYITKPQNFKTFCTILRQICKINNIPIESYIKYIKSEYFINYKILIC